MVDGWPTSIFSFKKSLRWNNFWRSNLFFIHLRFDKIFLSFLHIIYHHKYEFFICTLWNRSCIKSKYLRMLLHNSFNPKVQSIQKWLEATFASKNNFFSWPIRIRSLWIIIRKESLTNNGLKINVIWSCSLLYRVTSLEKPSVEG